MPRAASLLLGTLITMEKNQAPPTAQLADVFDLELLSKMLDQRYVKQSPHPTLPLLILNYTAKTQFDRAWNNVTSLCRGLIVDAEGRIVARPFQKFFNAEEIDISVLSGQPFTAHDKMDGSLGILYPVEGGRAIATRGSFVSQQALEGTRIWEEKYADAHVDPSWTYLFEIIYPGNRVVVDYEGMRDLILLGAVDNATGSSIPLEQLRSGWLGPVAVERSYSDLEEALSLRGEVGSEGLVLHFPTTDTRVKVKRAEYVRLHRLYTDVSERRVWEELSQRRDVELWLQEVPDEIFDFVRSCVDRLTADHAQLKDELQALYNDIMSRLPGGAQRKDLAHEVLLEAQSNPLAKGVFALCDGKDVDGFLWDVLRPVEHTPFFQVNNEAD